MTKTLSHQKKKTTVPLDTNIQCTNRYTCKLYRTLAFCQKNKQILQVSKLSLTELSSLAVDIVSIFPVKGV